MMKEWGKVDFNGVEGNLELDLCQWDGWKEIERRRDFSIDFTLTLWEMATFLGVSSVILAEYVSNRNFLVYDVFCTQKYTAAGIPQL